eukprot:GHRR01013988.1.p1 GENE.GHRR01013988.1~~GHRR01013988.1.p1  ORF type:complete len:435 (+),score=202.23 GHRR01013988.1:589-1893(+)
MRCQLQALQRKVHQCSAAVRPCRVARLQSVTAAALQLTGLQPSAVTSSMHASTLKSSLTQHGIRQQNTWLPAHARRRSMCPDALPPLAMINVDFASPSLVLGVTLIGCGIALLQVRNMQKEVSRDADIVVAAMISIVGSTLIFQGWRLDPLLLLCQALTTSVAFWYGLETFKLRAQVTEDEGTDVAGQLPPPEGFNNNTGQIDKAFTQATRPSYLPPAVDRAIPQWGLQQQQQQLPTQQQQQQPGRWGLPPADSTNRYEYLTQQQPPQAEQTYIGYDGKYAGSGSSGQQLPLFQQQQQQPFGVPPDMQGMYGSNASYADNYQQAPQQQYQGIQAMGMGYQEGWYGGVAQDQLLGAPGAGAAGQYGSDAALPAGAAGTLPDSVSGMNPAGYGLDGSLQLPMLPGEQQQQLAQRQQRQQLRSGLSQGVYEKVDDWE